MSAQATADHPSFQPRKTSLAAGYVCWQITERVEARENGCWEWIGTRHEKGYGMVDMKHHDWPERVVLVHRMVYRICVGPVPEGMNVLHRCDNPPCCRPSHLFLGTILDNNADKVAKGRQASGQDVRKNHDHLKGEVIVTAKLTAEGVMDLRRRDAAGEPLCVIADDLGISETQASYIVEGKAWAHLPVLRKSDHDPNFRSCPKWGGRFSTRGGLHRRHVESCDLLLGKE